MEYLWNLVKASGLTQKEEETQFERQDESEEEEGGKSRAGEENESDTEEEEEDPASSTWVTPNVASTHPINPQLLTDAVSDALQWSASTLGSLAQAGYYNPYYHHYINQAVAMAATSLGIDPSNKQQLSVDGVRPKEVFYVSFNQDCTGLAVGHEDGYTLYSLSSVLERRDKIYEGRVPERACVVERLYMSSLLTIVSMRSTRKLQVYHSGKQSEICCHTYPSAILRVKMNRWRVVVCLEDSIHIHNVKDMHLLHVLKDTPLNPLGIIDLSNDQKSYLALPSNSTTGHVMVFDTELLVQACSFGAHSGPIAALRFNPDGTRLATASDKGTVIRVFGVPNGERLYEFTRGMKRCVTVSSMAFSVDSRLLALSSNTETVHVFSLAPSTGGAVGSGSGADGAGAEGGLGLGAQPHHHHHHSQPPFAEHQAGSAGSGAGGGSLGSSGGSGAQEGIGAWVNYFTQQAQHYLPQQMNDLMMRDKSVATARLPIQGTHCVVAIPRIDQQDYLLVASTEGYLFCYALDAVYNQGAGTGSGGVAGNGECTLMRQYRIGPDPPPGSAEAGRDAMLDTIPIPIKTGGNSGGSGGPTSGGGGSTKSGRKAKGNGGSGGRNASNAAVQPASTSPPTGQPAVPPAQMAATSKHAPPIPPAPKSRGAAGGSSGNSSTNPFEVEDDIIGGVGKGGVKAKRSAAKAGSESEEGEDSGDEISPQVPPADLNDLDEFPPLQHATL